MNKKTHLTKLFITHLFVKCKHILDTFFFLLSKIIAYFSNKAIYYVVGDSHTLIFRFVMFLKAVHLGAATAFNINNPNSTTGSRKKLYKFIGKIRKKKDFIILSLGEIDCREHIYYQYKKKEEKQSIESLINNTIKNYGEIILDLKSKGFNVMILGIPPAYSKNKYKDHTYYPEKKLQKKISFLFNDFLNGFCDENGIKYINILPFFSDNDGFILSDFSNDGLHLSRKALPILKKLIKS